MSKNGKIIFANVWKWPFVRMNIDCISGIGILVLTTTTTIQQQLLNNNNYSTKTIQQKLLNNNTKSILFSSNLGNRFLHGVWQIWDLILGPSLQMGDPGCQLSVGRLQVLDQVPFVAVQLLLEPLDERGAVAGVTLADGTLKWSFVVLVRLNNFYI